MSTQLSTRPHRLPGTQLLGIKESIGDTTDPAHILGVVRYADCSGGPDLDAGYPALDIRMTHDPAEGVAEVWRTHRAVRRGRRDGVVYAHDGEYLFCAGRIEAAARASYADATRAAYVDALRLADGLGYRHIFRMWNYVTDINADNHDGLEVYRDFCRGRAEAFDRRSVPGDQLPAATGVGSLGDGIAFYFLATRTGQRINIENTRQMPAYHYPKRYGPRSPSFARATYLLPEGAEESAGRIYVSGTASVVGHETLHPGDVARQCQETLSNITHLVSADNLAVYGFQLGHRLAELRNIKVYVRRAEHLDTVREMCAAAFDEEAAICYFNVDICRAELLVEIEGMV